MNLLFILFAELFIVNSSLIFYDENLFKNVKQR